MKKTPTVTPRTIEAVGLAHTPGRHHIVRDADRLFKRAFIWLMFRKWIPLALRQRGMFAVMNFSKWLFGHNWAVFGGASKSDSYELSLLKLLFTATAIALVADNTVTTPLTNLFIALHTADPGEAGTQNTSEIGYTSYTRVSVARTSGGWTVSGTAPAQAVPVANISFPAGTGGSGTATYFSVGSLTSGAGVIYYSGTVTPNIACGNGVTPILTAAGTSITED